ncbi:MAG: OadG family protein [Kiritimatiellae bacterium]|nr:OadG family protein [Kiritimatiellia bacterium]
MLAQGLVLLVAGMGIVFSFLLVLVISMSVMAKIVPRFNYILPDEEPKKKPAPAASDDSAVALAIAVALSR